MRPTARMKHSRRIERKRQNFQIAGTIFFAVLMVVVLISGLATNLQAKATADKPSTSTVDKTIFISITQDETGAVPSLLPTGGNAGTTEPDKQYYDIPLSRELQDYIFSITEQYSVPAEVVIAIIERESDYRPHVTGLAGEQGLMQIHPINHEWLSEELGITDYYDPEQNILAGTYLLSRLFNKYDTATEALMCYNCGETGAKRLWAKGITETEYTVGILSFIETLEYKEEARQ